MSHGTTQERATLALRDQERAAQYGRVQTIQRQADQQRQHEEAQRLKLIEAQERNLQPEQSRGAESEHESGTGHVASQNGFLFYFSSHWCPNEL